MAKYTQIHDDSEGFLQEVRKACSKYTALVAKTAGPKGHNVMLIANNQCHLTKDGISVLRSIKEVETAAEKTAIAVLRGASEQTNKVAGDGTTATAILTNEIFQQGFPLLASGINGNSLRQGINKAAELAIKLLKENLATPVKDNEDLKRIARISSNGSEEIATTLADLFDKIGKDGYARVEVGNRSTTTSKIVNGMTFGRGMVSPYFQTNDHREAVLDNPVVLIINKKLNVIGELIKPFEAIIKMNRPVLVIADGYEQDIINTLVVNKLRGLPVCAVEAPSWGDWKTGMMEDIAVVCDGKVISPATGMSVEDAVISPGVLGHAKQVIVTADSTCIVPDTDMNPETNPMLKERIALLQSEIDDPEKSDHDKNIARTRKARLTGGIGIITVGGATEAEINEKKDLVDDAFSSVKSALVDGVVPGGGVTFLCLQAALSKWASDNPNELTADETLGFGVFTNALTAPALSIIDNAMPSDRVAGVTHIGGIIAANQEMHEKDKTLSAWRYGYNGAEDEMGDLVNDGVIDSAAALIAAITNGTAGGGSLLTLAGATFPPPPDPATMPQMAPGQMQ